MRNNIFLEWHFQSSEKNSTLPHCVFKIRYMCNLQNIGNIPERLSSSICVMLEVAWFSGFLIALLKSMLMQILCIYFRWIQPWSEFLYLTIQSMLSYVSSMSIWKVLKRNSLGVLLRNNDAFQDAFVSICKLLNLKLHSSNGCKVQLHKLPSSFQTTKCDL